MENRPSSGPAVEVITYGTLQTLNLDKHFYKESLQSHCIRDNSQSCTLQP